MCDPATLTIIAATTAIAGSAYSGYQQYGEAKYQAGVARNNAALSRNQAADAEERGKRDEMLKWREIAMTKSAQIAAGAANGLDTSFGSAADVVVDTAVFGAQDAQLIREGAAREATGFQISALNYEEEARAQRRAGRNALVSTAFDIAGTALGAAGQVKGMKTPKSNVFGKSSSPGSSLPNSAFKW